MSVPSQHSLPLQELSLRQMGHREWCPPLQLQQPAMLFQLTGHIKRNDLGTCTHLSIIPGPSWLFSSFVLANLAAMPFPDFSGGNMAVTIGKCLVLIVLSIAWLQRKLPLSFGILGILQEFKSPKWSSTSHFSLPQSPKICLDTSMSQYVIVCPQLSTGLRRLHRFLGHIVLSGAFRNLPGRSKQRKIAETTWRCDPQQVLAHSTQAAQQAFLVRTRQAKSGQKWPKVVQSRDKKMVREDFLLKPIKNLIL